MQFGISNSIVSITSFYVLLIKKNYLKQLGALYTNKSKKKKTSFKSRFVPTEPDLTDLGRILAFLPIDPQLSRLLLFGLFLKCFDPILTLVAALSYRDPCLFF